MVPEEDNDLNQFENMRKQLKVQSDQSMMIAEELYPERERNMLVNFLQSLKQYPKITAIMLKHQNKSINTLSNHIKEMFPQLTQRVSKSIECCKKNAQLLQTVKSTLQTKLQLKPSNTKQSLKHHQHHACQSNNQQHSHSHAQFKTNPNKLINIFNHLCREYSQQQIHKQQRYYIEFIKSTIKGLLDENKQMRQNMKTLVVGCGMGKTLVQLKRLYQEQKLPIGSYLVQGHQQDPQYYLLAEYLLNYFNHQEKQLSRLHNNRQKIQIYPYIHNFSNHLYQSTPYLPVIINVPQKDNSNKYGITFGQFNRLYKSHQQEWRVIITQFYNYSLTDILSHIQLIYKLLSKNGIWIDISTASFDNHIIPYLSYSQYQKILDKSQFKLLTKFNRQQYWYQQPNKIMRQFRKVYYRVMTKKQ